MVDTLFHQSRKQARQKCIKKSGAAEQRRVRGAPSLTPVKSLERRAALIKSSGSAIAAGVRPRRGVSSTGGNLRAFGEFIEDDKNQPHIPTPPHQQKWADESRPGERERGNHSGPTGFTGWEFGRWKGG